MKFKRLRLSGFKSFIDPVELYLEEGLTGIVGPNGCGKSNLVEALRWVMGENSPKAMRGSGMEDVIFAGSGFRPARNIAEVSVLLDNGARQAPAAFNGGDELEVARRIQREAGSAYRINGREVRARDVQLLFADAATGSHSPSIVSQGRVGALINSRPRDRRSILESAAGISGLHSRRHEAELRLKAAEDNLVRLADVMGQIEGQLATLKRQARHARRYQKLTSEIRQEEALLLYLRWSAADAKLSEIGEELRRTEETVTALTREAAAATTAQTEASRALPDRREAEAEAAAKVQRLRTAIQSLEREAERVAETASRLDARRDEVARDLEREKHLITDAEEHVERLDGERKTLESQAAAEAEKRPDAEATVTAARKAASTTEDRLHRLTGEVASRRAEAQARERRLNEITARETRLTDKLNQAEKELTETAAAAPALDDPETIAARLATAQESVQAREEELKARGEERAGAQAATETAREDRDAAKAAFTRLETEAETLERLLADGPESDLPPIVESLKVADGLETALGAALGEDLDAPLADDAAVGWRALPALDDAPALPAGVQPLTEFVSAPAALARRLTQIGVVDEDQGPLQQKALRPGQRLVSRAGSLWRWDGFTVIERAATAAALRLEQKNRLRALAGERAAAQANLDKMEEAFATAQRKAADCAETEEACRRALREAEETATAARNDLAAAENARAEHDRRLTALNETIAGLKADLEELAQERQDFESEAEVAHTLDELEAAVAAAQSERDTHRQELNAAETALAGLDREREAREQRLTAIANERATWQERAAAGSDQLARLETRLAEIEAERQDLAEKPGEIADKKAALEDDVEAAEAERQAAAAKLAEQEDAVAGADRHLKDVQQRLTTAREERIRIQASLEQTRTQRDQYEERIAEVLDCSPDEAIEKAGIDPTAEFPAAAAIEEKLERLKTERERMGPVNLRAETEAGEKEEELANMQTERADLEAAIARLRQAIGNLNREGRERLMTAFTEVNAHFEKLFQRLFGGGRAHLTLTESDDPLEAGLEIMASPPGKRLQVMSLLSGGEQALTALSLIFAVFLTNPSPVCVLDEVDAPLDDANVERLCDLLHDIARQTQTRFLIVTHHPLTMSRVNHLFGVTMAEQGVSQLVSVDLDAAQELRAAS